MLKKIDSLLDRAHDDDYIQGLLDADPFMDGYRKKIGLIALSLVLAGASLGMFYVMGKKMKPPEIVYLHSDGHLEKGAPVLYPNQSKEAIKNLALETLQKSYTFDFIKIEEQIMSAKPFFTSDAWPLFLNQMLSSSLVSDVKKNKFTVSVVAKEEPIIVDAARTQGEDFAWKLVIPATISFSGDAPTQTQDILIRMTVVRVPTVENPRGIAIVQLLPGSMQKSGNAR